MALLYNCHTPELGLIFLKRPPKQKVRFSFLHSSLAQKFKIYTLNGYANYKYITLNICIISMSDNY
jgi:hypothetical protein